jgi:hypothetical protein
LADADLGGEMHDGVNPFERLRDSSGVANVADHEFRVVGESSARATVDLINEGVEQPHLVATRYKGPGDVAANKASPARDEDFRHPMKSS